MCICIHAHKCVLCVPIRYFYILKEHTVTVHKYNIYMVHLTLFVYVVKDLINCF